MTKLTVDASTSEQLTSLDQLTEVCDESGRTIGYFHPIKAPSAETPITDEVRKWANRISNEEIEQSLSEPGGCTTEELIQELKQL